MALNNESFGPVNEEQKNSLYLLPTPFLLAYI